MSEPDPDDRYPMVPSHPGWDERSESTSRLWRVALILFAMVSTGAVVLIAIRTLG